jgi:hypothetical protein
MAQSKQLSDFESFIGNISVLFFALYVLLLASVSGTGRQPPGSPFQNSSIRDLKISAIRIFRADMDEALAALRKQNMNEIMIGFEEIPRVRGPQRKPITFEATGITLGEVLDRLVAADPRYTYEITKDAIINVYPRGAKMEATDLLNTRVSRFALHGKYHLSLVVRRIDRWVPELGAKIADAQMRYRRKFGLAPYGVATVGSAWNAQYDFLPEVEFDFRNMPVREILNALVIHSAKIYNGSSNGFPISWKYEFIIDPDAPTGLGGYPAWGQVGEDIPQEISW